jgi:hypothetical protein
MKKPILIIIPIIALSIAITYFFIRCSKTENTLSVLFESGKFQNGPDKELLSNYLIASSGYVNKDVTASSDVNIYVDKSSGINEAFSSSVGGELAKAELNSILGFYENAKYLGVLNDIKEFNLGGASPSNYFSNGSNYDPKAMAKLTLALTTITKSNNLSFFISDCEEFDNAAMEIKNDPWAKEPLIDWLNKGNSIYFWITDFNVKGSTKHLFFMAFAPAEVVSKDSKFKDLINELNSKNPNHFELSNKNWSIQKPKWTEQSTGLDSNLLGDDVFMKENYIRNFENQPTSFEYLDIAYPIKFEVLKGEGVLKGPDFYRGIHVDFSNNHFFDINKVDIDVNEVSNDLNSYATFFQLNQNKPEFIVNSDGAKVLNTENPFSEYYDNKGQIKSEHIYNNKANEGNLKELFSFNQDLFNNTIKSHPENVELGFKLHPNFNDSDPKLNNQKSYNLIRVDFKVSGFNDKLPNLNMFKWNSIFSKNSENTGFYDSIKYAILATQPKDKIIHSIFIKFIRE